MNVTVPTGGHSSSLHLPQYPSNNSAVQNVNTTASRLNADNIILLMISFAIDSSLVQAEHFQNNFSLVRISRRHEMCCPTLVLRSGEWLAVLRGQFGEINWECIPLSARIKEW